MNTTQNTLGKPGQNISKGKTSIYGLNKTGEGVGSDGDSSLSVPFALPGEQIEYDCLSFKKKKKYIVTEIKNPSQDRDAPICKHFGQCGGCMLQHMGKNLYREFKQSLLTNALVENGLDPFVVDGITILPFGTRRRANMDAVRKGDTVFLGFHRFQSHQIINIEECYTVHGDISILIQPLRELLLIVLEPFEKAKLFFTKSKTGVDISLEVQGLSELSPEKRQAIAFFANTHKLARFTFRYRKFLDVIHQDAKPVVSFANLDVEVDAYSFLQTSLESDEFMADFVLSNLPENPKRIGDLFCGRGTLSLPLATVAPVWGYEFDRASLAALQKVVPNAGHTLHLHYRDLFESPLTKKELSDFDVIVIDPPRAGAENQSHQMATANVRKIIYISCNPETFARDAKILTQGSFNLVKVHGLDQFSWSPHIEVLGVFEKNSN